MSTASCCLRWVFTLNNWTNDDITRFESINLKDNVHCLACQKEVGENGTHRLNGFVIFKKQKRFNQVKSLLGHRVHLSLMKGHPLASLMQLTTTSIEGTKPYIYGTIPHRTLLHCTCTKKSCDQIIRVQVFIYFWIEYVKYNTVL
jgi:Putative viral replication protein